ncbi:MAG: hypothetical protein Q9219_006090 [cf. Caloplaca sp. 3 TL-2023]
MFNQANYLAKTRRVILQDTRGQGRSPYVNFTGFHYDDFTRDAIAVLDHLNIASVAVVGWSDGGIAGLDLAMNYSSRIERVFAHGANVRANMSDPGRNDPIINSDSGSLDSSFATNGTTYSDHASLTKRAAEGADEFSMWATEPTWGPEALGRIRCPVWSVDGDHDVAVQRNQADAIAAWVPFAGQLILPQPVMATFEQRLKTFTNWPHDGSHAPKYMAAAGFVKDHNFPGLVDAATCLSCEMTMTHWDKGMDPITEHLDHSPRCAWITGKMMNTQEKREETFGNWPFEDQLSYMLVAAAGFFQSDIQTHTVTCYACQLTLGPQQLGNDPLRAHARLDNQASPCPYLTKTVSSEERALPPTPPPTPPLLRHQCAVCHNRFLTKDALRRHLVDPKKAHLPKARKIIGRRTAPIGKRRITMIRRAPDLASRITRPLRNPFDQISHIIKYEDD